MAAFPRANVTSPGKRCIIRYQFSSLLQPHLSHVPSISDPPKSPRVLTTVFSHSDLTSSQVDARFMTFGDLFGIAIRRTSHLFAFLSGNLHYYFRHYLFVLFIVWHDHFLYLSLLGCSHRCSHSFSSFKFSPSSSFNVSIFLFYLSFVLFRFFSCLFGLLCF